MLRAFLALDLDRQCVREVARLEDRLRGDARASRVRWVDASVMHVTLRFLGDVDEALVPALATLVSKLGDARREIALHATSLLAFPDERRARVLGLALEDDGIISEIALEAERAVVALGWPAEHRAFRPHLTLGRLRMPADLRDLLAEPFDPIAGRVTALTLYQSELGARPRYTSLARTHLLPM